MTTVLDILTRGRDRIARGWIQESYAREDPGLDMQDVKNARDPRATCWCMWGAIDADGGAPEDERDARVAADGMLIDTANVLYPETGEGFWGSLGTFNDHKGRTQDEVLLVFDTTIEVLKKQQAVAA